MKKFGLFVIGALLFTACDSTPGGNKDILPVVHDGIEEPMDHHDDHSAEAHEDHSNHATMEETAPMAETATESAENTTTEPVAEPSDSTH